MIDASQVTPKKSTLATRKRQAHNSPHCIEFNPLTALSGIMYLTRPLFHPNTSNETVKLSTDFPQPDLCVSILHQQKGWELGLQIQT